MYGTGSTITIIGMLSYVPWVANLIQFQTVLCTH